MYLSDHYQVVEINRAAGEPSYYGDGYYMWTHMGISCNSIEDCPNWTYDQEVRCDGGCCIHINEGRNGGAIHMNSRRGYKLKPSSMGYCASNTPSSYHENNRHDCDGLDYSECKHHPKSCHWVYEGGYQNIGTNWNNCVGQYDPNEDHNPAYHHPFSCETSWDCHLYENQGLLDGCDVGCSSWGCCTDGCA